MLLAPTLAVGVMLSATAGAAEPDGSATRTDPRLTLVSLLFEGREREALREAQHLLASEPRAEGWGLDYLRGRLLAKLERHEEASQALASALGSTSRIAASARLQLARSQERLAHPEVAAGLLAGLLASDIPDEIERPATELLLSTLRHGGDCRLLGKAQQWPLGTQAGRLVSFARAECARRPGDSDHTRQLLDGLLAEETGDDAARMAADRLAALGPLPPESALRVGLTFYTHREFERATRYLSMALGRDDGRSRLRGEAYDARYALARSLFWRDLWDEAADLFANLAARASEPEDAARARYQQARSLELAGDWSGAARAFGLAWEVEPTGSFSGPALLSTLRLRWRSGKEEVALTLYEQLGRDRRWRDNLRRAALFLASSDLVRGRTDRAATWLATAGRGDGEPRLVVGYWRGRLAELEGAGKEAVDRYLETIEQDPYHPIARAAANRLRTTALAAVAAREARRHAALPGAEQLYRAWLLTRGTPANAVYVRRLLSELAGQSRIRPFLALEIVPPERWTLWGERVVDDDEEELLLRIGLWGEAEDAVRRHFPLDDPDLALTGSHLLGLGGLPRRSLHLAELLRDRVPAELPEPLLPLELRRLLYPLPWAERIVTEARRQGIEPELLAAVIREESRFDANAVSAAQARGLTQFVFPTARRIAAEIGLGELEPRDLTRPAVSIALGAAYLAQLQHRFAGHTAMTLAAYNAGESQADLWRAYCYSREPEEYYTKIGFTETRGYLRKVLASQAQYREVYSGRWREEPTTGGSPSWPRSK